MEDDIRANADEQRDGVHPAGGCVLVAGRAEVADGAGAARHAARRRARARGARPGAAGARRALSARARRPLPPAAQGQVRPRALPYVLIQDIIYLCIKCPPTPTS